MKFHRRANPAFSAFGTVFLAAALLGTMYLTARERHWMEFLAGVLAAAVLALVSRTTNARWIIARRTAQLRVARSKLASQTALHAHAQEALAHLRGGVKFLDEELPAMVAYFDTQGLIRYHNRAYGRWAGLSSDAIDGKHVEEIVGPAVYTEIESHLREALDGRDVRYERVQRGADGELMRLHVQYLPNHDADGAIAGVFAILTDATRAADMALAPEGRTPAPLAASESLVAALERGDFSLYCQEIARLGPAASTKPFYEVQLRMNEEETKHLPPGAFFSFAEETGMLPEIDRWTVRRVVDHAADSRSQATYIVRISAPTLADASFAAVVRESLAARGLDGSALCFELAEDDVMRDPIASRCFLQSLHDLGCGIAVSGFGRNPVSLKLLQELHADFLKLDAGIVLNMLRSTEGLARVKEINKAAHAAGMRTVADCVESPCTRVALERLDTDFAQGTGIATSRVMGLAPHAAALQGLQHPA